MMSRERRYRVSGIDDLGDVHTYATDDQRRADEIEKMMREDGLEQVERQDGAS